MQNPRKRISTSNSFVRFFKNVKNISRLYIFMRENAHTKHTVDSIWYFQSSTSVVSSQIHYIPIESQSNLPKIICDTWIVNTESKYQRHISALLQFFPYDNRNTFILLIWVHERFPEAAIPGNTNNFTLNLSIKFLWKYFLISQPCRDKFKLLLICSAKWRNWTTTRLWFCGKILQRIVEACLWHL